MSDTLPRPPRDAQMDLLEYQGKQLFAKHGVPVPEGRHATTVDDAVAAANEIGYPCVIKAQVAIGGRGKAGGIKVATDEAEARARAEAILGMDIRGFVVHDLWVEGASEIAAEYYASIILDRSEKTLLAIVSRMGGMEVEEVAESDPDALVRRHIDPAQGLDLASWPRSSRSTRASTRTSPTRSPRCWSKLADVVATPRTRP